MQELTDIEETLVGFLYQYPQYIDQLPLIEKNHLSPLAWIFYDAIIKSHQKGEGSSETETFLVALLEKGTISSYEYRYLLDLVTIPYSNITLEQVTILINSLIKLKQNYLIYNNILSIARVRARDDHDISEKLDKIQELLALRSNRSPLSNEVDNFVLSTTGNFSSTDVYNCLQLSTRNDKKNVSIILARLINAGVIERVGEKNGVFRRVLNQEVVIDYDNCDLDPFVLEMPLDLHKLVQIYPKNIIVIAGEPNSGKTSFLLNLAIANCDNHDVRYVSSEMGAQELKSRLVQFPYEMSQWKKIKFLERSTGFADLIKKDSVNIIDYMEIHSEHYRIGEWIKQIFDKLDQGIAIIAIQKKRGADEGVGGMTTLEKPRLYLAMGNGKCKIVKAKAFARHDTNPNGAEIEFKLVHGANFIPQTSWQRDGVDLMKVDMSKKSERGVYLF